MGATLAQKINGEERAIYYLSKKFLNIKPTIIPWKKLPFP